MSKIAKTGMVDGAHGDLTDTVTQYFAYVAILSASVIAAVCAMVFSAQTALVWIDAVARPAQQFQIESAPATLKNDLPVIKKTTKTFAMLPASMPLHMQSNVVASNY